MASKFSTFKVRAAARDRGRVRLSRWHRFERAIERLVWSFLWLWLLAGTWLAFSFIASPQDSLRAADWQLDGGPVESYEIDVPRIIQHDREPVLVVRRGAKDFCALAAVCEYQHCVLRWDPTKEVVACPCHKETYDLNGTAASGRAHRPLRSYFVNLKADRVRVHLGRAVEAAS